MSIVLSIDVGGSHVKALTSNEDERRRFASGSSLTAERMVAGVLEIVADWEWDVATIGIPAPVRKSKVVSEPVHLGGGWVDFDYQAALGKPTQIVNDAAMQAVG